MASCAADACCSDTRAMPPDAIQQVQSNGRARAHCSGSILAAVPGAIVVRGREPFSVPPPGRSLGRLWATSRDHLRTTPMRSRQTSGVRLELPNHMQRAIDASGNTCPHCGHAPALTGACCTGITLSMRSSGSTDAHPLVPVLVAECPRCGHECTITFTLGRLDGRGRVRRTFRGLLRGARLVRRSGGGRHER